MASVYERNFARLVKLLGQPAELDFERSYRLTAPGFMNLFVERLPDEEGPEAVVLSLAHYFEQSGDLCQDPEMTVRIGPQMGGRSYAEALTFQQSIPPIYREVYPEPGKFYPKVKRQLNAFLELWLKDLGQQGHRLLRPEVYAPAPGTGIDPHYPFSAAEARRGRP